MATYIAVLTWWFLRTNEGSALLIDLKKQILHCVQDDKFYVQDDNSQLSTINFQLSTIT